MKDKLCKFFVMGCAIMVGIATTVSLFMIFATWTKVNYMGLKYEYAAIDLLRFSDKMLPNVECRALTISGIGVTFVFAMVNWIVSIPMVVEACKMKKLGIGRNIFMTIWFIATLVMAVIFPTKLYMGESYAGNNKYLSMGDGAVWVLALAIIGIIFSITMIVFICIRRTAAPKEDKKAA